MTVFTTTNEEVDASVLEAEFLEALKAGLGEWTPSEGDPLLWLAKAVAREGAAIFDQASTTEEGMFKRFGEAILSIPPVQAAPASVESTWTMVDNKGHEVPAGTQVLVEESGETKVGFITVGTTVIPPGATTATIVLQAIKPGEEGNGLTGDVSLSDSLAFVLEPGGVVLNEPTAGGVDEEDEETYLGRLVETIRLLSLSLVVPPDFEVDARAQPGIARCLCIPAYNAETKGKNAALHVTDVPIDEDGEPLSAPEKTALKERQQAKVPSGVTVHVIDPEYTPIDVEAKIEVETGFDPTSTASAAKERLAEIFDQAKWGLPTQGDSGSGWVNRSFVYYLKLVGEVEKVGGVGRVIELKLGKHGKSLGTADLELEGIAPLTKPGTFTVTTA
jgi:hypothetical protein